MIDPVKDFLVPKRFGIVAYVCVIVHFLCGLVFIAVTTALRASENGKFSCSLEAESTATYKKQVDQSCFARYDQTYNSPLPLYGFVLLSIGLPVLVSVIYSLMVRIRVDEIESSHERQNNAEAESGGQNRRTVYVFYFYLVHLITRSLVGITFTVLQHIYFYANGFEFKFVCILPPTDQVKISKNTQKNVSHNVNSTSSSVDCENATASEKRSWTTCVSVINIVVAIVILVEVIYLLLRLPILSCRSGSGWSSDDEFVAKYFLRKSYINVANQQELANNCSTRDAIHLYKQEVLSRPRAPDVNYLQKSTLDDMYIDLVIHTERAKRPFSEELVDRHEIYDVYTETPTNSIRLEKIKDIFQPNKDTENTQPHSILAIGRPGIGKTVMTEKIIRDWANEMDVSYSDKIAFIFKFRWFNNDNLENISLKTFLQFGTLGLSEEYFDHLYEELTNDPGKAILIFDGLDEFHGDPINCLEQTRKIPNDCNTRMSAMNLCIKLIFGDLLKGATVLVTTRPTANDFYSKLDFDRNVEIIGFRPDKIEEYVKQFCENCKRNDLAPQIWSHIQSSSELSNLCYIPVNCFIVCVTLSECLMRESRRTLPTTLTGLYQTATNHFQKYHHRTDDGNDVKKETLGKLQQAAFCGIENDQLVFNEELFDEQLRNSGLVNSLSNPIFPLKTQFCYIHLTVQEFLAAKHATETLAPAELKKFISDHVRNGKWHLVLQFIAGLVGEKIKMEKEYKECLLAFAESIDVKDGIIIVRKYNHNAFVMKCLKEVDNEHIAKDVLETNEISGEMNLHVGDSASPDECAVITFSGKIMKNVVNFYGYNLKEAVFEKVLEFLQKRCVSSLQLHWTRSYTPEHTKSVIKDRAERTLSTLSLATTGCTIKHKHSKLTRLELDFDNSCEVDLLSMFKHFETERVYSQLECLSLECGISSPELKILCDIFNNGHHTKLRELKLNGNAIGEEGVSVLSDTLVNGLRGLTSLSMHDCSLTVECMHSLCKALQDGRCQLSDLDLGLNKIGDEGARELFENCLENELCKLTKLNLGDCSLTNQCISSLCKALQDARCQLTDVNLSCNDIGDKGARELFENGLTNEHCKLTKLSIWYCSLTNQCISSLCKALQDERCQLTDVNLGFNKIGDKGARELFENGLTNGHCKLTKLILWHCSLTDQCIPSLREAQQYERSALTNLFLSANVFTDNGMKRLRVIQNSYKSKGLKLVLY